MRNMLLASVLLVGVSVARPASAEAGFFFSFSEPGFGIAVGTPFHRPGYYYPPPPVVYVPPPVVWGGYHSHHHHHYPHWGQRGHAWGYGHRSRGHRWR